MEVKRGGQGRSVVATTSRDVLRDFVLHVRPEVTLKESLFRSSYSLMTWKQSIMIMLY